MLSPVIAHLVGTRRIIALCTADRPAIALNATASRPIAPSTAFARDGGAYHSGSRINASCTSHLSVDVKDSIPSPASRDTQSLPPSLYAVLAGLTLGWGFNWPVMKLALAEIPVWSFRAFCVLAGAAGIALIGRAMGHRLWPRRDEWAMLAWTSLFNVTLWNLCIGFGLTLLPAGRSAILAYTMPLWTVLLSALLLGEALTRRRILGLACGAGALLLLLAEEMTALRAAPLGTLLVVAGAMSWAVGTIVIKRMPSSLPITSFTAWQFLLGGLPMLAGALAFDPWHWQGLSVGAVGAVAYNVMVSFIYCHWAWFRIVQQAPAGVAALSTLLIPVIGVLSSMLVLGDRPGASEILALVLVLAALATVLSRPVRRAAAKD